MKNGSNTVTEILIFDLVSVNISAEFGPKFSFGN